MPQRANRFDAHSVQAEWDAAADTWVDMPDIPGVLRSIHDALAPGGRLIASIAHPCTDAAFRRWQRDETGRKEWLRIGRYSMRTVTYAWSDRAYEFRTSACHATLEDWFEWLDARSVFPDVRCTSAGVTNAASHRNAGHRRRRFTLAGPPTRVAL